MFISDSWKDVQVPASNQNSKKLKFSYMRILEPVNLSYFWDSLFWRIFFFLAFWKNSALESGTRNKEQEGKSRFIFGMICGGIKSWSETLGGEVWKLKLVVWLTRGCSLLCHPRESLDLKSWGPCTRYYKKYVNFFFQKYSFLKREKN